MTEEASIRAALEERLNALTPPLATAWENVDYKPAGGSTPYQRVALLRGQPESLEMGLARQHVGLMQVTLFYPQNTGSKDAEERAGTLASWFPRSLALTKNGIVVTISDRPYVMPGFPDADRWAIPVRIPYFSNVTS